MKLRLYKINFIEKPFLHEEWWLAEDEIQLREHLRGLEITSLEDVGLAKYLTGRINFTSGLTKVLEAEISVITNSGEHRQGNVKQSRTSMPTEQEPVVGLLTNEWNRKDLTDTVYIYTDGACSSNPGPGGWAFCEIDPNALENELGVLFHKSGFVDSTTNNQMELTAILMAVTQLKGTDKTVHVFTDSANAIGWLDGGWRRNNPSIKSLCEGIEKVCRSKHLTLQFHHVDGHSGNFYNEYVDQLAVKAYKEK